MNLPTRDYMKLATAIRAAIDASKTDRNDKTAAFLTSLHQDGYEIVPVLPLQMAAQEQLKQAEAVRDAAE